MLQNKILLMLLLLSAAFCSMACDDPRDAIQAKSASDAKRMPRTDVGSYESLTTENNNSTRDILIYWMTIADSNNCNESYGYHVHYNKPGTVDDNRTTVVYSNETYENFAKFNGLSTTTGYNFTIYSTDKNGMSKQPTTIYVPSESERKRVRMSLTKTILGDGSSYELTWRNNNNGRELLLSSSNQSSYHEYFTIFWCERNDEHYSNQCKGNINWTHVSSDESTFNVTVADCTKSYRFAISANRRSSIQNDSKIVYDFDCCSVSTGLVWESCTVLKKTDNNYTEYTENNGIKMENVWIGFVSSTFFELKWYLDCSEEMDDVQGYRIMYCPIVSKNDTECIESMINQRISPEIVRDEPRNFAFLRNLKPYTTYKVTIALITKHGEGLPSKPIYETTDEGAPDISDLFINVTNVTNSSVDIQWTYPKFMNGNIRYFLVQYYTEKEYTTEDDTFNSTHNGRRPNDIIVRDNKCHIDNLESNIMYTITVTACTTHCSVPSIPVQVRTKRYIELFEALDIQELRLNVLNVTNTSVEIQVTPSLFMLSILEHYRFQYYLNDVGQEQHSENSSSVLLFNVSVANDKYRLDNLESYRNYTIIVIACASTECSVPSTPIRVQTAIGQPGKVALFDLQYESDTSILVPWSRPIPPGGPVDYYQLVGASYKGPTRLPTTYNRRFTPRDIYASELLTNPDRFFFVTNSTEIVVNDIPIPSCKDRDNLHKYTTIYVSVRAVNKNPHGTGSEPFYGTWSDTRLTTTRCTVGSEDYDH